jgi:hypothetical protein
MYESRCLVLFAVSGHSGPVVHSAVWCWRQDSHSPARNHILHCVAMYVVLFGWHYCVKLAIPVALMLSQVTLSRGEFIRVGSTLPGNLIPQG